VSKQQGSTLLDLVIWVVLGLILYLAIIEPTLHS
jgi:hypothetical protein